MLSTHCYCCCCCCCDATSWLPPVRQRFLSLAQISVNTNKKLYFRFFVIMRFLFLLYSYFFYLSIILFYFIQFYFIIVFLFISFSTRYRRQFHWNWAISRCAVCFYSLWLTLLAELCSPRPPPRPHQQRAHLLSCCLYDFHSSQRFTLPWRANRECCQFGFAISKCSKWWKMLWGAFFQRECKRK